MLFIKKINQLQITLIVCSFFSLAAMEYPIPPIDFARLTQALDFELDRFAQTQQKQLHFGVFQPPEGWLSYNNQDGINHETTYKCYPFAQGAIFPAGTNFIILGDIHGDYLALKMVMSFIEKNREIASNPHYVFLGDYGDRSRNVLEDGDDTLVYHWLLNFYNNDPNHVTLLRGNHEDIRALYRFDSFRENSAIMPGNPGMLFKIATSYEFLPVAFFAGCRTANGHVAFIQFCHGGIEPTYNPQPLLRIIPIKLEPFCQFLNPSNPEPQTWEPQLGLLWNSFNLGDGDRQDRIHQSMNYGYNTTSEYLERASCLPEEQLYGVFGGHQHYGDILDELNNGGGLATLYGGKAHVMVSAYPELRCISFSVITVAERPEDWMLTQYTHRKNIDDPGHFNITYRGPVFEYLRANDLAYNTQSTGC